MTKMTALFAELAKIDEQMSVVNPHLSVTELTRLDDRHAELWEEIVAHKPSSKATAELMTLMLLDKMQVMAARGESCMIVREKLLELFSETYAEPQPYLVNSRVAEPSLSEFRS
ncbi:MAG: hypothetical protein QNJ29_09745 [Rhizobiaceae bacterium]|nr:hypothetical protein [Rhizobiaceae bacterium]